MKGSFQLIIDELARRIEGMGGRIETNALVERVFVEEERVVGLRIKDSGFEIRKFDVIIATIPSPVFLKIVPELSGEYAALLRGVRYQAALCLVLKTKQPLSHIYWLNISDRDIPFVAVIEHTNYVSPDVYGGRHFLYISNYLSQDSPLLALSEEELLRLYLPGIKRINPLFGPDWVEDTWLFRDDSAQPIITCNYSQRIPDHRTPVKGLYLANTTQIYPADRGINYSVELGRKVARMVVLDSKERNSTS
jgi:protoporphyrinogen oxidase